MRNSYRRWIRNSKLVCAREKGRVVEQSESLVAERRDDLSVGSGA